MLTAKQIRFVAEYSLDRNASRAARAAGYGAAGARVTACRLLTNPNVAAAVIEQEKTIARTLDVTRADVLRALQGAFEDAKAQSNPMAMIAACREIAKLCGYYENIRIQPTQSCTSENLLENMTDRELALVVSGGVCVGQCRNC